MPTKKREKLLCVEALRHSEYYGMQATFDNLYARSSAGEKFTNLMKMVMSRENILLAYRNIKANSGSNTPGTDNLTIKDIGKLTPEEMVAKVRSIINGKWGYRPRPVRRKEIPKPNGSTRPLGIPCMWDRLIQQCIKQIMEPICEAKFSNNSYGFRPMRSVENAIQATYCRLQKSNLHYVIEFDIKSFFDEVNHSKLIKQIWAMGIQDKHLIYVLKQILTAPIMMPDGSVVHPVKGTPQGGIISPLLANIVLNELDHWVESQWEENPVVSKYHIGINKSGSPIKSTGYAAMRRTQLKEMYIVRYADDFRIFCRTKTDADKTRIAVTQWIEKRLRLQVSAEKTRVVNVKRRYSDFLGFKIKVHKKSEKYVVTSHIADKSLKRITASLTEQAKNVAKPRTPRTEKQEITLYNQMVEGVHNYFSIATGVCMDCNSVNRAVMTIFTNRLGTQTGSRLVKTGRPLTEHERKRYSQSACLRYEAISKEPIYPVSYVQCKKPMQKKRSVNPYSAEGRMGIHDNLRINSYLMLRMMRQPLLDRTAEYADNRISLFSAQWGKCAVTGTEFTTLDNIQCHHIIPRWMGGTDKYQNLILILPPVHRLIHASRADTIAHYLNILNLDAKQLLKVNDLRKKAGHAEI